MSQFNKFAIDPKRLMDMAIDLTVLVCSHRDICNWLGPYDETDIEGEDFVAQYYRVFFEERLSYLLITLACLLRNMDDQEIISKDLMEGESENIELAEIRLDDEWTPVKKFRTVLNTVMHCRKLDPLFETDVEFRKIADDITLPNTTRFVDNSIVLWTHHNSTGPLIPIRLNLRSFSDMVFRVVEELRSRDS